ncbi:MAG TPA: hypothetical protein VNM16_03665 [Bacillota bacterium]|nr:hypothetical protein [Bacillota bacterium]
MFAIAAWVGGLWGAVLAAAFLVLPAGPFLFPTIYGMDERGVALSNPLASDRKPWSRFVAYRQYPDAVQLLFDPSNPRGWWLTGHLLYFNGNRDLVMATVKRHLAPQATRPAPAHTPRPPAADRPRGSTAR